MNKIDPTCFAALIGNFLLSKKSYRLLYSERSIEENTYSFVVDDESPLIPAAADAFTLIFKSKFLVATGVVEYSDKRNNNNDGQILKKYILHLTQPMQRLYQNRPIRYQQNE